MSRQAPNEEAMPMSSSYIRNSCHATLEILVSLKKLSVSKGKGRARNNENLKFANLRIVNDFSSANYLY